MYISRSITRYNNENKRHLFYTLFLIYEQHFTSVARNLWNWSVPNVFSTFVNERLFDAVQSNMAANRNFEMIQHGAWQSGRLCGMHTDLCSLNFANMKSIT